MSPINFTDVVAAVVLSLTGTGLLGRYLLQRYQADHETRIVRLKTELEADIRTLQAALDRTIFVHRAQFDTEFAALRDIWGKVATVRATMALIRPELDLVPANETPEAREMRELERFRVFIVDLDALVKAVDTQSPFVPREIYQKLEQAIQVAGTESDEVQLERHERERDWLRRGREHYQQFCEHAGEVSDLIRARLERLTVTGDR
jgi:hypothetical protein